MGAAIAGISIEPGPSDAYVLAQNVTLTGVSGDMRWDDSSATASLVRFTNAVAWGEISGLKAEGDFGGGVIRFDYANTNSTGVQIDSALDIHNCSYNAGGTYPGNFSYPTAFVQLTGQATPFITMKANSVNNDNLIKDLVVNRTVLKEPAPSYLTGRPPLAYDSYTNGVWGSFSKLMVGQTAFSEFYPTNVGWYRVMQPIVGYNNARISGRLTFSTPGLDNTELQVDVSANSDQNPWFSVNRAQRLLYTPPAVTKARAFTFWRTEISGNWAYVDLYVANTNANRMTVALDVNGYLEPIAGQVQLMAPIQYLGTNDITNYIGYATVNTYR